MGGPRRFVIVGLTRLSRRVARLLADPDCEVVFVLNESERVPDGLPQGASRVVYRGGDMDGALREAGLVGAECLLALSDDDLENLNAAVAARSVASDVPVVLRAFDPSLADQLRGLNIRRAYSMSGLAAPAFVAAALSDEVVETLRLGDGEVTILRLTARPGSPILGRTAAEVKRETGCAVIGRSGDGVDWRPASLDERLDDEGEQLLVGGPLFPALQLAIRNGGIPEQVRRARKLRRRPRRDADEPAPLRAATLLPVMAAILAGLLLATIVVFGIALHMGPIDAAYFAVSTALGNSTLDGSQAWLKVVGVLSMLLGGALIGVVFSWLASVATAQRLEQRIGRRARDLSGHAVVVGLGTVGYRVAQLLHQLGIPTAAIDRDPDPRFSGIVAEHIPVLTGDVRLREYLERAGTADARWFIACTPDDLTNIEACLSARRLNPTIRTVARIFDADLAERVGGSFGIDAAVSSSLVSASAFAGAAGDERAIRAFRVGELDYLAFRFDPKRPLETPEIERWRGGHVRVLAFRRGEGPLQPPSELTERLEPGDSAILAGPAPAIRSMVFGDRSTGGA
jgi:Trk K+ transport system NAD-binding subunit